MDKFVWNKETVDSVSGALREAALFTDAAAVGAVRQIREHPAESLAQAGATIGTGALLTVGLAAESPVVAFGTLAVAGAMTGRWLFEACDPTSVDNWQRNEAVRSAIRDTWLCDEPSVLHRNMDRLEQVLGPTAFEIGLGVVGGHFGARLGAQLGSACSRVSFNLPRLPIDFNCAAPRLVPALATNGWVPLHPADGSSEYVALRHGPVRVQKGQAAIAHHDKEMQDRSLDRMIRDLFRQASWRNREEMLPPARHGWDDFGHRPFHFHSRYGAAQLPVILALPFVVTSLRTREDFVRRLP